MINNLCGVAVEDVKRGRRPVVRMKYIHCGRQVPQPVHVFLLHRLHVDVDGSSLLGLQTMEYYSAKDHVADHQAARADRREQKSDELAKIFAAQLLCTSPRYEALNV